MQSPPSRGFGLVELLIVVAIVGILAGISVPALLRARAAANESAAIASLRVVNSAQRAFAASCGDGLYAPSLRSLGAAPEGNGQAFLSVDLAKPSPVTKNGYEISLSGEQPPSTPASDACSHANGGPAASELLLGYVATAVAQGTFDGSKDFWTNTGGALFEKPHAGSFTSTNILGWPVADPQARPVQSPAAGNGDVGGMPGSR